MSLEIHGARIGGLCVFGETGLGWLGPHHCFYCARFTGEPDE